MAVIPKTAIKLNILEPTKLPIEIAFSLFIIAIIDAVSSGILVPKDTIETLIILSLTPILSAKLTAPLIKVSEPNQSENHLVKGNSPSSSLTIPVEYHYSHPNRSSFGI